MKKHPKFQRDGADLFIDMDITLKEALLGFKKSIQFLDGSPLKITSSPGKFISNGDKKTVKGKGMPFFKRENTSGDLHIKFNVKFPQPDEFSPEIIEELNKVNFSTPISTNFNYLGDARARNNKC